MKIENKKTCNINLYGEDVDLFKSAINKIIEADKKIGFSNAGLDDKEKTLLDNMKKELDK